MGRLKRRPGNCAGRSINCKRRLKSRAANSKPREKKGKPSTTRLQETSSKLGNAQKEAETSKDVQIAEFKKEVAAAEEARATAEKQRDEANAKLAEANSQIAVAEQQRDEALAQLKAGTEKEQDPQALLAENGDLKLELANLEENVPANVSSTNVEELVAVKQEVTQLQQQLGESQKQNQYLVARIAELWVQLDEAGAQLQSAKLTGKNSDEIDRLMRENELLRDIVVRERQEEARRDEARKLMLAELDKLRIKSDSLNKEIELLAQPVTKLSSEELSLLRQPVVSISEQTRGALTASFIFAKKSAGDSVEGQATTNNSGDLKEEPRDGPHGVVQPARESFSGGSTEPQKPMSRGPDQGSD